MEWKRKWKWKEEELKAEEIRWTDLVSVLIVALSYGARHVISYRADGVDVAPEMDRN